MRIWFKEFKDTRMLRDMVVEDNSDTNRTKKVFEAIDKMCFEFDLGEPIWLESSINEFKRHAKVKFRQDNFVETIEFDYLEMHVIEED